MPTSRTRRERGFVLVTMAVAALAIVGALGMAVDVGRAFIAKNETQTFCDSAAYAAVLKLDISAIHAIPPPTIAAHNHTKSRT